MDTQEQAVASVQKKDRFLPISILVAGVLIAGSIVYLVESQRGVTGQPGSPSDKNPIVSADAQKIEGRDVILGDEKAKISFIEYGDYQCPFCTRFFTQVEQPLRADYIQPGKVKMVFRNFQFLGPESQAAGEAAECAKDQQKFWPFHDAIYTAEGIDGQEHNGNLNRTLFLKIATDLKFDIGSFTSCIDTHKYAKEVQQETATGANYGVNGTPTVFINGVLLTGVSWEPTGDPRVTALKPYLDDLLK